LTIAVSEGLVGNGQFDKGYRVSRHGSFACLKSHDTYKGEQESAFVSPQELPYPLIEKQTLMNYRYY